MGVLDGSGASPGIDAPKIHYGSERGDALTADGVGNSWGGGGSSGGADVGGVFVYMMARHCPHTRSSDYNRKS